MEKVDTDALRKEVDALISNLRELGRTINPLELLSRIAFHHLMRPDGEEAGHNQSEAQVEFILSLFLASSFPENAARASPQQVQDCIDTLDACFSKASIFYALTSESKRGDRWESELISTQRMQTLHVRGEAYGIHARQTLLDIGGPHDPFLQGAYGFTTSDVLRIR
jgi:hypothetical protein